MEGDNEETEYELTAKLEERILSSLGKIGMLALGDERSPPVVMRGERERKRDKERDSDR